MPQPLYQHRTKFEGTTVLADGTAISDIVTGSNMLLPFVSFEGETRAYQQDSDFQIPLLFKGITLDEDFDNPFSRSSPANNVSDDDLNNLAAAVRTSEYNQRFSAAAGSFDLRAELRR